MTYRADTDALRARLDAEEDKRVDAEHRADHAEAEMRRMALGEPSIAGLRGDVPFTLLKVFLWLQFTGWLLFVLVSFPTYVMIAHDEPPFGRSIEPVLQGIVMWLIVNAVFAPVGIASIAGAIGLGRGRRWGWIASMIASGLSLLCGCVPIGVAGIIILLRDPVRTAFFAQAAPPPPVDLGSPLPGPPPG